MAAKERVRTIAVKSFCALMALVFVTPLLLLVGIGLLETPDLITGVARVLLASLLLSWPFALLGACVCLLIAGVAAIW